MGGSIETGQSREVQFGGSGQIGSSLVGGPVGGHFKGVNLGSCQ